MYWTWNDPYGKNLLNQNSLLSFKLLRNSTFIYIRQVLNPIVYMLEEIKRRDMSQNMCFGVVDTSPGWWYVSVLW